MPWPACPPRPSQASTLACLTTSLTLTINPDLSACLPAWPPTAYQANLPSQRPLEPPLRSRAPQDCLPPTDRPRHGHEGWRHLRVRGI